MSVFLKKFVNPVTLLCAITLLLSMPSAKAQIIFSENFQDSASFARFTLVNRDNRTPAANVGFVNAAWVRVADLVDETDTIAMSTSWYDPVGAADDWMISPQIHIDSQSVLIWDAQAENAAYPDGYEVRISTTTTDIDSFLTNFALFNINAENPDWTNRYVNLASKGYANQDVYIAFRNTSNDMLLLSVDDIKVQNPYPVDARALALELPPTSCQLGNAESITVTVENFGLAPLTNLSVTYVVDDGVNPPVTVTETITNTINPFASLDYTFTQKADLSAPGTLFEISAYVSATSDADLTNDSLESAFVINVVTVDIDTGAYTTSFETQGEILGWSVEDNNADSVSWFLASGGANTGDILFLYEYNAASPADDWLFSTCLDLTAGTQYELTFFDKVGNSGGTVYPEKLKVAYGLNPNAASMDSVIEDLGELTNDFYQEESMLFEVPTSGTYYIGFHCYSDADQFRLFIDDVTVAQLVPPVPAFTTSKDELEVTFLSTSTGADSLYWDFGDSSNSTSNTVVHTYAAPGTYYVCLTAVNEVGTATFCDSVSVDTTTIIGIALIDEAEFSVFPNPTQGAVVVEMNEQVIGKSTLVVSDLVGKELLHTAVTTARMQVDLSGTPEGVYFITLQAGESQLRRKIILAR